MHKYVLIFTAFTLLLFSCSKNDKEVLTTERTNPEARNQEGTKLLGLSRVTNGTLQWSTVYYENGTNRISKIIDSSMNMIIISEAPVRESISVYNYDAAGKLISNGYGTDLFNYIYDATGKIIERNFTTGKNIYTYASNGRIASDSSYNIGLNHEESYYKFTYDAAGNISSEEEWQYDNHISNLAKIATSFFSYDDKQNPYAAVDPNSFVYKPGPHNPLTVTSVFTSGNSYVSTYLYTYNSFGLPKSSLYHSGGVGSLPDNTTKYYYY